MISPESTVSIALIFSIIAAFGTVAGIITNVRKNIKDTSDQRMDMTRNFTKLEVKIDEYHKTNQEVARKLEANDKTMQELAKKLVAHAERIESLNKITDEHEQRIKRVESAK